MTFLCKKVKFQCYKEKSFLLLQRKTKGRLSKNIKKKTENFPSFIKKLWESYSSGRICAIMMKVY